MLDCRVQEVTVGMDWAHRFAMRLPEGEAFYGVPLEDGTPAKLSEVER